MATAWKRTGLTTNVFRRVCIQTPAFASVDRRLRETGTFAVNKHSTGRGRSIRTPHFDEGILQRYDKNPSTNTRAGGHAVGVNRRLLWNVEGEQNFRSFHRQKVQALLGPNDHLRRDQFVRWFVHQNTEKSDFPAMLLFTNETCFTREGIFNSHNDHVREEANPVLYLYGHQQRLVVDVWAGTVSYFLTVPNLLPRRLKAQIYRGFLEEKLPEILEENPGSQEKHVVPAQQGCGSLCTSDPTASHRHLQLSLDWAGRTCGLASQVTGPHTNELLPMGQY